MINALEKVVYPNGKTQSLAEIGGAVEGLSALIDEVDRNTSAISSITSQLSALVSDVADNTSAITSIQNTLTILVGQSVEVTADGVKTFQALLNELWDSVDTEKITRNSKIIYADNYIADLKRTGSAFYYCYHNLSSAGAYDDLMFTLSETLSACKFISNSAGTISDLSETVATNGLKIKLVY